MIQAAGQARGAAGAALVAGLLTACTDAAAPPTAAPPPGPFAGASPSAAAVPSAFPVASWQLADGKPPVAARQVTLLVQELTCASGRSAEGRIVHSVEHRVDALVVTIRVRPLPGGQSCQGVPPTPYLLPLDEPVAGRRLVNGARDLPGAADPSGGRRA